MDVPVEDVLNPDGALGVVQVFLVLEDKRRQVLTGPFLLSSDQSLSCNKMYKHFNNQPYLYYGLTFWGQ